MTAGGRKMRGRATGLAAMLLAGPALGGCADQRAEWARFENAMRAEGLMRTDYAPADAPFTKADLIRNFEKVAFHTEFAPDGGTTPQETPAALSRQSAPLRWQVFGSELRDADQSDMAVLMRRVGKLTPLRPRMLRAPLWDHNEIFVIFLTAQDRADALGGANWRGLAEDNPFAADWLRDDDQPCMAYSGERTEGPLKGEGISLVFIRDELDGLMRRACIEEEVIQSLGLPNDGDDVRPSMFNDDGEFALMTRHDELLLRILYDPRLKNGMNAEEGMPIVRRIVADMDLGAGADPIRMAEAAR